MKVVLIGATGMIGSRVLQELISRGHQVTAIVRDPSKLPAGSKATAVAGNILDANQIAELVKGSDAIISAYSPGFSADGVGQLLAATRSLIDAATKAAVKRVIMVGGAGSLYVAPGVTLIDSGHLPEEWKPIAIAHRDALENLRSSGLDWTYFSPAAFIQPGERTGKFRIGTDNLVTGEDGQSRISAEDYAIALVDELEQGRHMRRRFTVGY